MMKLIIWPLIFISVVLGCSGEKSEPGWKTDKILRVGTDATYPPFEMVNVESAKPEGFDIDIMTRICELNGWTPEFIVTPFDGIISGLKGRKYDCVISAMTITPQRQAIVDFSDNYYLAGQIVAVSLTDTIIKNVDDLRGRKVGVQLGTTGERFAKSLAGVTVLSFDNIGAAFIDMKTGRIDAVLNDFPTTREYIKRTGTAKTVGELLSQEYYGIAVRKNDKDLLLKINDALEKIKSSGEYEKITARWL